MTFSKFITEHSLNHSSDFTKLAQAAIECHYLIPFPNKKDRRPNHVNRHHHGGLHVSMVARHVDLFLAIYEKYAPHLLINMQGSALSEREIKLLKLSAIYHDSANTGERFHDEAKHAECFRDNMLLLGFSIEEIEPFAYAIQHKDAENRSTKTIFQKIIHDADCLDIIRIVGERFEKEQLDSYLDLSTNTDFIEELQEIIQNQIETAKLFKSEDQSRIGQLHIDCENSTNCYETYCNIEYEAMLSSIVIHSIKQGHDISVKDLSLQSCRVLDFYKRNSYASTLNFTTITDITINPDLTIFKYNSTGVFVRVISQSKSLDEFNILTQNEKSLERAGIHDAKDMRDYLLKQKLTNSNTILTPEGFKWRPCSLIKQGIPVTLFGNRIGLIIDPEHSNPVYFYKKNAKSKDTITGTFEYTREKGGLKDKGSNHNLLMKLNEMNARRCGKIVDPNHKYYGLESLPHNEVLANYSSDNIIGILVPDSPKEAINAVLLRAKIGAPFRPLFKYSQNEGLIPLTPSEAILQNISKSEQIEINCLEKISADTNSLLTLTETANKIITFNYKYNNRREDIFDERTGHRNLIINTKDLDATIYASILHYVEHLNKEYGLKRDTNGRLYCNTIKYAILESQIQDTTITLQFSNFIDEIKDMNSIIKEAAEEIDRIISGQNFIYNRIFSSLENIALDKIGNIFRARSEDCASIYSFQHPSYPQITCSMQMHDNQAIIYIVTEDGTKMSKPTSFLNKISKKYYEQLTIEINQIISNVIISNYLICMNLFILNFNFSQFEKYPLVVKILNDGTSLEDQTSKLLTFFELPSIKKIRTKQSSVTSDIHLIIEDLNSLENIHEKLLIIKEEILSIPQTKTYANESDTKSSSCTFWNKKTRFTQDPEVKKEVAYNGEFK